VALPLVHLRNTRSAAYPSAAAALGSRHPVARATGARSLLGGQLAVTSGLLVIAAIAAAERGGAAIIAASAALVLELALAAGFICATGCLHERARDVVADGNGGLRVAEIAAERERLARPAHRERLACALERALLAAEHWPELWVATRPPPGVLNLLACAEPAREVARLVRDPRTPVRGVALLDRLMCGGYGSTLYHGPAETLVEELARIRFLLKASAQRDRFG
jgi:hypothetical protein